jgi:hypothetical protein
MKWNPDLKVWVKTGSHAVNVFGYSRNESDGDDKILVYLSNPTRMYNMDGSRALFDIATLENINTETNPDPYASVELKTVQGRLLNFEGKTTFMAGLILTKPD